MIGTKVTRVCVFAVAICCFIGIDGVVAHVCQCPSCESGPPHLDQERHRQMNLLN